MKPKIAIIILNWNGSKDLLECLESLYQINYPNYDVIVVDNDSEDDSIEKIKEYCNGYLKIESKFFEYKTKTNPIKIFEYFQGEIENLETNKEFNGILSNEKLMLIKNNANYGFAEGNNVGMRFACRYMNPDYILLLNNDLVVDKNFLTEMVNISESKKDIGIVGPKTYYYDYYGEKNVINFAGGTFDIWKGKSKHIGINEVDIGQYDDIKEVDYVEGSCLLIKKELVEKIKLLNPFLFGWEEIDWSLKAKKLGYKCYYISKANIWHKVGSSLGIKFSFFKLYYHIRSGLIVMDQNTKWYNKIVFIPFFILDILSKIFILSRQERDVSSICYSIKVVIKAFLDYRKISSNSKFQFFDQKF